MNPIWLLYITPYLLIIACGITFTIILRRIQDKILDQAKYIAQCENRSIKNHTLKNDRLNYLEENFSNLRKPLNDLAFKLGYRFLFPISDGRQHEYCDCNKPKLVKVDEVENG